MKDASNQIPGKISELLQRYEKDMESAWSNCGEGDFNISFSAKIGFDKANKPTCEVGISFITGKIKDSLTFGWNDKQLNLLKAVGNEKEALGCRNLRDRHRED